MAALYPLLVTAPGAHRAPAEGPSFAILGHMEVKKERKQLETNRFYFKLTPFVLGLSLKIKPPSKI